MLEEIIKFSKFASKLKKVKRGGWVRQGIKNPESVADHSFMTAVLAMVLADLKGLDTEKMMRMALLHELEEVIIGDLTPYDKAKISVEKLKEMKEKAEEEVVSSMPVQLRTKYRELLEEHKSYETKEAKLLNEIDNLEMVMQALEYEKEGVDKKRLDEFWDFMPKEVKPEDKDVIKIFEMLKKERKGD